MSLSSNRVFLYCGKNSQGQYIEGRLRAENSQWAKHKLRKKGIKIRSLKKAGIYPSAKLNLLMFQIFLNLLVN